MSCGCQNLGQPVSVEQCSTSRAARRGWKQSGCVSLLLCTVISAPMECMSLVLHQSDSLALISRDFFFFLVFYYLALLDLQR